MTSQYYRIPCSGRPFRSGEFERGGKLTNKCSIPRGSCRATIWRNQVTAPLADPHRKEAFEMVVGLQDNGRSVEDSRDEVAAHFGISVDEVAGIEQEGIDKSWPPLGERR